MENNYDNREKLAMHIVDGMDSQDLISFAFESLMNTYKNCDQSFAEDWEVFKREGSAEDDGAV